MGTGPFPGWRGWLVVAVLAGLWAARSVAPAGLRGPKAPLRIEWRLGPDYPMGIQDSALGVVDGQVVSAGGFTRRPKDILATHPDAFGGKRSGFTKLTFAFDPRNESAGWQRIADMPGQARQGPAVAAVDDALYLMGGMSYDPPHTYRETYRLRHEQGKWEWQEITSARLPWPVYGAAGSTAVIGRSIYLFGVADFFPAPGAKGPDFHVEGREGNPVGRALLVLDTSHLDAGWQRLPDCPGLAQFDAGVAAAGGKLYRLGGIHTPVTLGKDRAGYYNAVDSWRYDPAARVWSRLADMPQGTNRRALTYADRYILLVAGYKYGQTWHLDGTVSNADPPKDVFEDTVLVYDAVTGQLSSTNSLIERTSYPSSAIVGNTIYCLGGEGGPRLWHPATFHIGKIAD